jgi:hypothetical protein
MMVCGWRLPAARACGDRLVLLPVCFLSATGATHLYEVGPTTTVADVKELVQAREGECAECASSSGRATAVGGGACCAVAGATRARFA